jgi:peroxiredoxin Q/BCP
MTDQLHPGDPAPDFDLPTAGGASIQLGRLRGSRVILYFYPAAGTPGCTAEACDFRDSLVPLQQAGYTVLGISPDAIAALEGFAADQGLTFPLLSDVDLVVHHQYGAWGEKTVGGETVVGPLRSTFVVDEDGVIEHVLHDVQAQGHVAQLRELLGVDGVAPPAV